MANRFFSPDQQFADSTGAALSGAQLFFYVAGTSTKQNTYSDKALSIANANPVVLDSSGRAGSIFLQNLAYKVVLAPSTDTDPPTSPIWTIDNVWTSDFSATAQFLANNGNPNGSVAGTAGSAGIPASSVYDFTNHVLYVCTTTGTAGSAVWTAVNPSSASVPVTQPSGRLTLQSATPVMNSDQIAASSVIYTPYVDQTVPINGGSAFAPTIFTELTLTLNNPAHVASTIYDVFIFSNSGTLTLATGPAWSSSAPGSSTRGTGAGTTQLTMLTGHLVNAVSMTGRNGVTTYSIGANLATYLGSIFIDGTSAQVTCHFSAGQSRKFGVWNAFQRVPIALLVTDGTASWSYTTGTFRASNGNSANSCTIFCGLQEEQANITFTQYISGGAAVATIGVGGNTTTTIGGVGGKAATSTATASFVMDNLGVQTVNCNESGASGTTFNGTITNMLMTAIYRG